MPHWPPLARHVGLGVVEQGAQRSASGQGDAEAFAGDLITTNPSGVHDGRPLGTDSRRWRMVYLELQVVGSKLRKCTRGPTLRPSPAAKRKPRLSERNVRAF